MTAIVMKKVPTIVAIYTSVDGVHLRCLQNERFRDSSGAWSDN